MKVLALAAYPIESAATRYRLSQYVKPLEGMGVTLDVRPFIGSTLFRDLYDRHKMLRVASGLALAAAKRLTDVVAAVGADVILVQREAMNFGPPIIERLAVALGRCPLVLDLDDPTNVRYVSPTYGHLGTSLKCVWKTDELIHSARLVTCGNDHIAAYARSKGAPTAVIPTVVDTDRFRPRSRSNDGVPVVGWIGTHSTYPFLESILPALRRVAAARQFRLRIIGGTFSAIPGIDVEAVQWTLGREVEDFQDLDVGLYPIDPTIYGEEWVAGKSGFKAIQYMAVGIPFIMSPVGVCKSMGSEGTTHFAATTLDEWANALDRLLADIPLRRSMGEAGRRHVVEKYSLPRHAELLRNALEQAISGRAELSHVAS